ncbi:hypothetical protein ACQCT3_08905 [Sutcliffiella horikoshii]|uniref:hypothetical protein n=1 Tax=Sutcliffiella horikoshii TaxID=79883 RepID=UPI0002E96902
MNRCVKFLVVILALFVLVGCSAVEEERDLDEVKKLGFSYSEMKDLWEKPEEVNDINQLQNKEVLQLIMLGFSKGIIKQFSDDEITRFLEYDPPTNYRSTYKLVGDGTEWDITSKEGDTSENEEDINQCDTNESIVCSKTYRYQADNGDVLELTTSISQLSNGGYVSTNSFDWVYGSEDEGTDIFGLLSNENLTVDYSTVTGRYQTEEFPTSYNASTEGYIHKFQLNKSNNNQTGYNFAEVLSGDSSMPVEVGTVYIHKSEGIEQEKIFKAGQSYESEVDEIKMIKTPVIKAILR